MTLGRHGNRCHRFSASRGPVDPEGRTEHAQEQGHLQEDQQQEVGAAQQEPVGDMGTDSEQHPQGGPAVSTLLAPRPGSVAARIYARINLTQSSPT